MSKIFGILTFHNANNYGAALQAYALQRFLREHYGQECAEVIDYKCNGVKRQKSFAYLCKTQGLIKTCLNYPLAVDRINKISKFGKRHMRLSEPIAERKKLKNIISDYDYIISGSDQLWNRNWTGGEDTYLQDFHDDDSKKVSYAVSFGLNELPEEWLEQYSVQIRRFSHISVREEAGKQLLKNTFSINADVHIDPTLLLTSNQWDEIKKRNMVKKPYVLVYMVPYQKSVIEEARFLASKNNLRIVIVCKSLRRSTGVYKGNAEVEEVISLFKDASYVVTNSFHGTAFSVIYHKKFAVDLNNRRGYNIRSAQLLNNLQITDPSNNENNIACFDVDWDKVESILAVEREKTKSFFNSLLDY